MFNHTYYVPLSVSIYTKELPDLLGTSFTSTLTNYTGTRGRRIDDVNGFAAKYFLTSLWQLKNLSVSIRLMY